MQSNEIALCPIEDVDTIGIVSDSKPGSADTARRGRTVPIAPWWRDAVKRELKKFFRSQLELAKAVHTDASSITRCLKHPNDAKSVITLDLVVAISDALKLPYPVILPDTEDLAEHLAEQRRLYKSDLELSTIKAGVAENTKESQPPAVASKDARKGRTPKQNVVDGLAGQRQRAR